MRQVGVGLIITPAFQPQALSQSLERWALATSMKRPVNGFTLTVPGGSVLFRTSTTRARRYSAPTPRAKRPSVVCHAIDGWTEIVLMFASRETKRPIHGSSQFVRRPNGVNTT